jgi:high-affinity iron transporter
LFFRKSLSVVRLGLLAIPLLVVLAGAVPPAFAQDAAPVDVHSETAVARDLLTQAMAAYRKGDYLSAFKLSRGAYLEHFELIEPPLRVLNQDLTLDMELRFADLRAKFEQHKSAALVEPVVASVRDGLTEIDAMFGGVGMVAPLIAFGSSALIAIREGLEAMLVIGTLLGALRTQQSRGLARFVLIGAGSAVLVSVVGWLALHTALSVAPVAQQVISAVASLVAVGMLLWVNHWLWRRRDPRRWLEMLPARTWAAVTSGSAIGLGLIGFSAVLRQGIESALLYEVLIDYSAGVLVYIALGLVGGLLFIGILAELMVRTGQRLSAATFLTIAMPLLMALSIAFVGGAVYQLQESGYLVATSIIRNFPRLPFFVAELTGIHPTAEGIGAQLGLIVLYGLYILLIIVRQQRNARRRALQTSQITKAA